MASIARAIGWPAEGELVLIAESDGLFFYCAGLGVVPAPPTPEEALEMERAYAWGRDPRQCVPPGWRLLED